MTKFEITIDLVVTANDSDDVHAMLPSYGDVTVSGFWECKTLFDVTLTNTVEAETAEEATATIGDDMRKAFSDIAPDWNAIIFQDDDEKIQLFHGAMRKFDELGYIERTNIYTGEPEE